jgi:hypothetical protein
MPAETIEQVVEQLSAIIERAYQDSSRLGFFAALYRRVTVEVKAKANAGGYFENDEWMQQLDVVFANRYLNALDQYEEGQTPTQSWKVAFDAANDRNLVILQHLLLGMNAHISFDLGVAAADMSEGKFTRQMRHDFFQINDILKKLTDTVKREVISLSPVIRWGDWLLGPFDDSVANFSMAYARDRAWAFGTDLVASTDDQREDLIAERDAKVADYARRMQNPGLIPGLVIVPLRWQEEKDVGRILDVLTEK